MQRQLFAGLYPRVGHPSSSVKTLEGTAFWTVPGFDPKTKKDRLLLLTGRRSSLLSKRMMAGGGGGISWLSALRRFDAYPKPLEDFRYREIDLRIWGSQVTPRQYAQL